MVGDQERPVLSSTSQLHFSGPCDDRPLAHHVPTVAIASAGDPTTPSRPCLVRSRMDPREVSSESSGVKGEVHHRSVNALRGLNPHLQAARRTLGQNLDIAEDAPPQAVRSSPRCQPVRLASPRRLSTNENPCRSASETRPRSASARGREEMDQREGPFPTSP
jgi:hypothetical protein